MTKRDLVVKIARETGFIQNDVAEVVQKTLDYIAEDLIAGNTIELRNFGVFEIKVRKSRKGRNPNQPKNEVIIPERAVVSSAPARSSRKRSKNSIPLSSNKLGCDETVTRLTEKNFRRAWFILRPAAKVRFRQAGNKTTRDQFHGKLCPTAGDGGYLCGGSTALAHP